MQNAKVKLVYPGSVACDAGIEAGDVIESINGKSFNDILDFKFYTSEEHYTLLVAKKDGTKEEIEIYNDDFEPFGAEFENPLIDKPMLCKNKCIFCFMDQLPENVRKTMLFKDDDVRLSFLQGNYVTLTNLTDDDIERICRLKVSPLNISVHVTDPQRRVMMLANPKAANVMDVMTRFAKSGIMMNAQIVLCPGINDGDYLTKTIDDLSSLFPQIKSVSIVPVGISKHRQGLYKLQSFTKQSAAQVVDTVTQIQQKLKEKYNTSLVFLADEFYIKSGTPIPPYEHYEDFAQIENGVGLIASFKDELFSELEYIDEYKNASPTPKIIATGYITYEFMQECAAKIKEARPDVDIRVERIKNDFFGDEITVTGLVTGGDIINQLKGKIEPGSTLLISESMLKSDEDIFLDDTSVSDVEAQLGVKVIKNACNGIDFLKKVLS